MKVKNNLNMEQEMIFGLPKKREVKEDKYKGTPVLILLPRESKKSRTKMITNNDFYETLGFNEDSKNEFAISYGTDNTELYIVNAEGYESKENVTVSKKGTAFDKRHWNEIRTRLGANEDEEIALFLEPTERVFNVNGNNVFALNKYSTTDQEEEEVEELKNENELITNNL